MRIQFFLAAMLGLAACAPEVQSSNAAFESYPGYIRGRDAQLNGSAPIPPGGFAGGSIVGGPITGGPITGGPIAGGGFGAPNAPEIDYSIPAGIAIESGEMTGAASRTGISDEQDFGAVSSRESIESDRQRLEQQRAQYQQIAPTALPERDGRSAPNIVEYAIRAANPPGVQAFRRNNPLRNSQFERSCARFASQDLAQEEFLRRGGPERDPRSLDPDGDGFACRWDPTPFRSAVN